MKSLKSTVELLQSTVSKLERAEQQIRQQPKPTPPTNTSPQVPQPDKKLNVVVYGLTENPPNTKRQDRVQNDIKNVLSAFSVTDTQINANCIKYCHHLGKYNAQSDRPRPLLVKFLRYTDASNIIRNKTKLASQIYVKPDLTYDERTIESLLLKERRSLIDKGISRQHIKIRK